MAIIFRDKKNRTLQKEIFQDLEIKKEGLKNTLEPPDIMIADTRVENIRSA